MDLLYSASFSLMIAFFSSFDCFGCNRPEIEVTLSKNSVSVSKNSAYSRVMCFKIIFSRRLVTSGKFSRKGSGTFLP
jgi:hypothetical protein